MTTNTRTDDATDNAELQAKAQLESIREMLAAVSVDYDRLEELREELEAEQSAVQDACDTVDETYAEYLEDGVGEDELDDVCEVLTEAEESLYQWGRSNGEELAGLEAAAGGCTDEDDARQRIQDDPLSVQIRSGWYSPGETLEPGEFEILLCTGGPAVRIIGELGAYNEPSRAWLEFQDWGTSWTSYYEEGIGATLLEYAQHFYFGE
jgi:hypothetical protein